MGIKTQLIALYTIVRREMLRMYRISSQVFLPPMITTLLYFLIFGSIIGSRIGAIEDITYTEFIAPGLIMMSVITNAYSNVSSSFFNIRFQHNVEEMLISPMHYSILLFGFVIGGIFRGVSVAILIFIITSFFVPLNFDNIFTTLTIIILVSALFSFAGFTNALLAKNFDDIAIIPTFILAPLTYLGGVFYTTSMLHPVWQNITYFNPILYMVNALRQSMIMQGDVHLSVSMMVIIAILLCLIFLNLYLLKRGIGLRSS